MSDPDDRSSVGAALDTQAVACDHIGSPLYGALLRGLRADFDRGGVTAELLVGVTERPTHDALPLRYLACGHRLALAGHAPQLARHYLSCGGSWDGSARVVDDFVETARAALIEFREGVRRYVQTNEVGRAVVLASGFAHLAQRHQLPIDQFEIGGSAGLLSHWDRFLYDTGSSTIGDPNSPLRFGPEWWRQPAPQLRGSVTVRRRSVSDIAPIDIHDVSGRTLAMSFVWPDQPVRFERLRAAIEVASGHPEEVERADAGEWVSTQLADGPADGAVTVVFHSIVWQYLPRTTRDRLRSALRSAGDRATANSPLVWLRMEPAGPGSDHAELRAMAFPSGEDEVLAEVGYHGADIRWMAPASEPAG